MGNAVLVAAKGKGVPNAVRRAGVIATRYGLGPSRMDIRISQMVAMLSRHECQPTLPITASVAERNPSLVQSYAARGVEFAIHGYHHVDHTQLAADDLRTQLERARHVLLSYGLPTDGFRAPYLRADDRMLVAMREAGFGFDSSQAVHWPIPRERETPTYQRALEFYGAVSAEDVPSLPTIREGLVRIPYCLPDDESVVDRLRLSPDAILRLWLGMFDATYERGELLTLGVHPERIAPCARAIAGVLEAARARVPEVWIARLGEIARWWRQRSESVVHVAGHDGGSHRIVVDGPRGLTIEVFDPSGNRLHPSQWRVECRAGDRVRQVLLVESAAEPAVELGRWPDGARSALAVTGDIDALTIRDYTRRLNGRSA